MTDTPDSTSPERDERHRARMVRKKAVIDARIAEAQDERGLLLVHTGIGKGKSSSAFGMAARALGHGMKVGVVQFIKGRRDTGEQLFFKRFPDEVRYHVMGEGFTWDTQDRARDLQSAAAAWASAVDPWREPATGLVLLDELNIAFKHGYLEVDQVLADLAGRPAHQHVVVTGRGAPPALVEAADTVTDMSLVKHAFQAGVRAQQGIEW